MRIQTSKQDSHITCQEFKGEGILLPSGYPGPFCVYFWRTRLSHALLALEGLKGLPRPTDRDGKSLNRLLTSEELGH